MSEFILFLVIAALCGLLGYDRYEGRKERQKLIQVIMSRNAQDLKDFELTEKLQFDKNPLPSEIFNNEDLIAVEQLSEKEFDKHVLGNNNQEEEEDRA